MRVIAGRFKGRALASPTWTGLRPTSDRLRETLFNVLATEVPGASVLDVYAGTGAVGIEALSRGARTVTFVEQDRRAVALIGQNLARCAVTEGCVIVARDAGALGGRDALQPFDIVFLDPPYDIPQRDVVMEHLATLVAARGVLVLEHATRQPAPATTGVLVRTRAIRQGDSTLTFYREASPQAPGADG